jgi:hypothetical protein
LQRKPGTDLHHGHNCHGNSIDPGSYRHIPTHRPGSVFGDNPAGHSRHDLSLGAAGFEPCNTGNVRDLRHTNTANRVRGYGRASHFHVGSGRLNWNLSIDFRDTNDIGRTEYGLFIYGKRHSYDDVCHHDDVVDREPLGYHSHANRRQLDRDHRASVSTRQSIDRGMQRHSRRPSGDRRDFAAHNARNSEQPRAGRDTACYLQSCRHQHQPNHDLHTDAELGGMQRKYQYEPCKSRDDGGSQCDGGSCNSRRLAAIGKSRHNGAGECDRSSGYARCLAAIGLLKSDPCWIIDLVCNCLGRVRRRLPGPRRHCVFRDTDIVIREAWQQRDVSVFAGCRR